MTDDAQAARAAARRSWPGRVGRLEDAEEADAPPGSSPGERIAMVWRLTLDAWAMAGRTIPDYPRSEAPGGLRRLGDPPLEFADEPE